MPHFDFTISFGNILTLVVFACSVGVFLWRSSANLTRFDERSNARYRENAQGIAELRKVLETVRDVLASVNEKGSLGARHLFDALHQQAVSHEGRINSFQSSITDVATIRTDLGWIKQSIGELKTEVTTIASRIK